MHGLVNKALEDMLVAGYGEPAWRRVLARADVGLDGFLMHEHYDDAVTYALVAAASAELAVPADEILERFGRHWIVFTADQGYADMLAFAGSSLEELLGNLDEMHARIALILPGLQTPSFQVERGADGALAVRYYSRRPGLAPMVLGLLRGLGERFGERIDVAFEAEAGRDHVLFRIARRARRAA